MSQPLATRMSWRSLPARTLSIVCRPAPITFPERRAVLQVLKQHGDIEVFRKVDASPTCPDCRKSLLVISRVVC